MKIAIQSDLHFDVNRRFPENFLSDDNFDVLVLPGDICEHDNLMAGLGTIRALVPNKPIIYVPGNHDWYNGNIDKPDHLLSVIKQFDMILLHRDSIEIDGVTFVGCTGWPLLDGIHENDLKFQIEDNIADFQLIKQNVVSPSNLSAIRMRQEGFEDIKRISEIIHQSSTEKNVVVTHYPPITDLRNRNFKLNSLSSYFCNNHGEFLDNWGKLPTAWIYGHTHDNVRGNYSNIEFFSNQYGYGNQHLSNGYDRNYVCEV